MPEVIMAFNYEIQWAMDPADPDKPQDRRREPDGRTESASYARYQRVDLERWQYNLVLERGRAIEPPTDDTSDEDAVDAYLEERRKAAEERRKQKDAENLEALKARVAEAEKRSGAQKGES
jgi:hypothetical protein